jgi:hypothetical protein
MSYRAFLILITIAGLIPSLVCLVFFTLIDRPRHWDRYARFIAGLMAVIVLNYAGLVLLALVGTTAAAWPSTVIGWAALVLFRGTALALIWSMTWLYFTPRVRRDTPVPGSIPPVQ